MTDGGSRLARATKLAVITSTFATVLLQALHAGRDRWDLPVFALIAAVAGILLGRWQSRRAVGFVLAAGYLTPALMLAVGIGFRYWYLSIWMSALLGAMAASSRSVTAWHYQSRLRFPLIAWALAVSVTWPIVSIRVLDWNPMLIWRPPFAPSDAIHAVQPAIWVAHVASVHLVGLLWMDWLSEAFAPERDASLLELERLIMVPALVAAIAGAALGAYQGFVDLNFVSLGVWSSIGRAAGPLADANASGALCAMWVGIALVFAVRGRPRTMIALALGTAILLAATYASSSRTATLCAVVALGAAVHVALSDRAHRPRVIAALVLVAVVAALGWTRLASSVTGPIKRAAEVLPGISRSNLIDAGRQLWERNGYGSAGNEIILERPLAGVGVGGVNLLSPDYFYSLSGVRIPADNAQNWFRHQFAELGLLGSVGWIGWSLVLLAALFAAPRPAANRSSAITARYTIIAFGLASLLGMPSQQPVVALTVWMMAFWLLLTVSRGSAGEQQSAWPYAVAALIALAFAGATAYAGRTDLRPPELARRFGYLYEYGVYDSLDSPQGETQTERTAVAVMSAPTGQFNLRVWVEHPDANRQPVEVTVWVDGQRVVHSRFQKDVPLVRTIPVPGGGKRFVLETLVDRTYASTTPGRPQVGLNLAWKFLE